MMELNQLRKLMREKRNALTHNFREDAAQQLLKNFKKLNNLKRYKNIGVYYAFDGEINLNYIIEYCWCENKKCFLPVVIDGENKNNNKKLIFREYSSHSMLQKNRFGISESKEGEEVGPEALDLILLPLTAFDLQGHRLGMGQGYYDRTLKGLKNPPKLVGVGYNLQGVEGLIPSPTDVTLDAIITEKELREF